jgi:hypothetical protein
VPVLPRHTLLHVLPLIRADAVLSLRLEFGRVYPIVQGVSKRALVRIQVDEDVATMFKADAHGGYSALFLLWSDERMLR